MAYGSYTYDLAIHLFDVAMESLYFIFSMAQIKGFALDVRQVFSKWGGAGRDDLKRLPARMSFGS